MESGSFSDLLQQAEQLTADIDSTGDLPRVERNLRQILEAGQQLWSRTTQAVSRDTSDVKASILLGSRGYDLPSISHKLDTISTAVPFEPVEPIKETDIQGFLKNERENAILSIIEESKKTTFERASQIYWENMENEWEREKQKILNALVGNSQEVMDISLNMETSKFENVGIRHRTNMDTMEMAYAKEVRAYVEQVIQGGLRLGLANKFLAAAKELDDHAATDLWEMVHMMTDIPLHTGKDTLAARCSVAMQNTFVKQARKYLENKYVEFVRAIVYGNLQDAALGGIPGIYHLVLGFLKVRAVSNMPGLQDGNVSGQPVWPLIYYCIRCGNMEGAIEAASSAGTALTELISYLTEYMESEDRRLSPNNESQMRLFYRRSVRLSTDPFKRAVYCILGCCDVSDDHSEVADKTEDYLWLRLCQLRTDDSLDETVQQDRILFSNLQTLLLEEYGENHFGAYQQPFLYFKVLFLTAQFEAAIEFLSRIEHLKCHAVHVAVVLYEQNFLALPPSLHSTVLTKSSADKSPMRRLNFARLIMLYTRKFDATDPQDAMHYFFLLRDLKGIRGENLFVACVSELVLETKEFEMLLGKMEQDNCRLPGLIDKFQGDTQKLIEVVAEDTEAKGLYEDSVNLYDLAKKHEKALELLNKLLSQVISQVSTPGSTKNRLEKQALDIAERYKAHGHTASRETTGTFYLLLDLITFFNQFHNEQLMEALDTVKRLKLLPFETDDVEGKVNAFSQYSEEIRRNIPDILLATMNILFSQYKTAKNSPTVQLPLVGRTQGSPVDDDGKEKYISYLRKQARTLIVFAGMIPYRMPGDTNARLVQLEVLMN